MRNFLFPAAVMLAAGMAFAADEAYPQKAAAAFEKGNRAETEFWIARQLLRNEFVVDAETDAILKKMRLEPKGFMPASWSADVQHWFLERGRSMWTVEAPYIHTNEKRFEIATAWTKDYFATLTAVPEIQAWYEVKEGLSTERKLLIAGAGKPAPAIAFGREVPGEARRQPSAIVRLFSLRALHHGWLEFKDEDGDGAQELTAHLTWIISNGVRQTKHIYRVGQNGQLKLWKTVEAPDGTPPILD